MIRLTQFVLFLVLLPGFTLAQQYNSSICLNQAGFYCKENKLAVIVNNANATLFFIINNKTKDTAFSGSLSAVKYSKNSGVFARQAEFSELTESGEYYMGLNDGNYSNVFHIQDKILEKAAIASIKAFYFQRSDCRLEPQYAYKWERNPGHPDTVVYIHSSAATNHKKEGIVISTPGGWYDAGDYNKYIVNSGITMGTLLSAYEDFPEYFKHLTTGIPESTNSIPDLLDEIIYNLRWMLTMQDRDDGGVYHKCTNAAFDGMVMPGVTKLPRYVVQKSTAASLDFVAVMAQAYRVFSGFPELAKLRDSCMNAGIQAWEWSLKNPDKLYDQAAMNKQYAPEISTGAYGDHNLEDEWFWSASEMFITTKDSSYLKLLINNRNQTFGIPGWNNVFMLGIYSLIRHEHLFPALKPILNAFRDSIINIADRYVLNTYSNAFGTVMGQSRKDFIWGSNAVAANQGILLINAFLLTKEKKYLQAALANADYLMGRNATGYYFITGQGYQSPMHPHHRISEADGVAEPVPGLLVGGPNPAMQDHCHYIYTEPETAYIDYSGAFACNEVAINWNAPLVYLLNAIQAIEQKEK
jgi:endoglucanase